MADKTETVTLNKGAGATDETVTRTWVDMGDGTHAPKSVATLNEEQVSVVSPNISVASAISGQITVTTPGTAVQGPDVPLTNGVWIKALTANTGNMYIWHATGDGRTGWELDANQVAPPIQVTNLNQLWFDASVGGEKVCWIKG